MTGPRDPKSWPVTSFLLGLGGLALIVSVGLSGRGPAAPRGAAPPPGATAEISSPAGKPAEPEVAAPELVTGLAGKVAGKAPPETTGGITTITARVRSGDRLVDLLRRNGIGNREAHLAAGAVRDHFNPKKLQIGQAVEIARRDGTHRDAVLERMSLRSAFDEEIVLERTPDGGFAAQKQAIPTLGLTLFHRGTIDDSLYLSARGAGVPDAVIVEMIRLFSFEVDFQREIRPGDGFEVYFRRRAARGGREIENGEILYAALTLRGRPLRYFRFHDEARGRVDYFDEDGKSARRALMKTPVDGARLSSRYGRRKHPILGYTRMHKGVDFAAGWGTPIMAAGDGRIVHAGRNGGFGNYVEIRHNGTYSTGYAHLSKYGRGIRKGARVRQGQIIGHVGATGLAKGSHLHYEVLVNGKQVNPMTLKLPDGHRLEGEHLNQYLELRAGLETDLVSMRTLRGFGAGKVAATAGAKALPGS